MAHFLKHILRTVAVFGIVLCCASAAAVDAVEGDGQSQSDDGQNGTNPSFDYRVETVTSNGSRTFDYDMMGDTTDVDGVPWWCHLFPFVPRCNTTPAPPTTTTPYPISTSTDPNTEVTNATTVEPIVNSTTTPAPERTTSQETTNSPSGSTTTTTTAGTGTSRSTTTTVSPTPKSSTTTPPTTTTTVKTSATTTTRKTTTSKSTPATSTTPHTNSTTITAKSTTTKRVTTTAVPPTPKPEPPSDWSWKSFIVGMLVAATLATALGFTLWIICKRRIAGSYATLQ